MKRRDVWRSGSNSVISLFLTFSLVIISLPIPTSPVFASAAGTARNHDVSAQIDPPITKKPLEEPRTPAPEGFRSPSPEAASKTALSDTQNPKLESGSSWGFSMPFGSTAALGESVSTDNHTDNVTSGNITSTASVTAEPSSAPLKPKRTFGTPVKQTMTFTVNPDGSIQTESSSRSDSSDNATTSNATSSNATMGITIGDITLRFPKDAVSTSVKVEFTERVPLGSTGMKVLRLFELNAKDLQTGTAVTQFNKDIEISIQHDRGELDGLDLDSLRLYYLNEETRQWLPVTSSYNLRTRTLTASVNHFTNFGEQANPLANGPGRVMASEVDMHSGTAVFSYPIEVPPGPGGFQPKVELTYNSGAADGMKNRRDMGSWVGIGWSLHLGRISQDQTTKQYSLDLNGGSYELASINATDWRTRPDQYFKITRSSDNTTWELLDRGGAYYRFGGTTDSRQYVFDNVTGTQTYRWDLSLLRDTNNNTANITYIQDIIGTSPNQTARAAYPGSLKYGKDEKVEVRFNSSYGGNITDTNGDPLRRDNPKSSGSNPAPKIMEIRRLDSIEVKFDSSLVRKYAFSFNTTDSINSSDYGGIYYSGAHTLVSINQTGTDGTPLPAMTFTYQNLQTYRHTNEGDYVGNPGNPASFSWPHLTWVSSGYGGDIFFSYVQIPNVFTNDIWTRQVVILSGSTANTTSGGWWDAAWSSRRKLTFNTTNISENLTDFPVLVHLTSSNFDFSSANVSGKDIRFFDSDNSTLDYEIETWNATASEAWVWVRVPQVDGNSTSDYIWLYYGNPGASDSQNAIGVWNSDYRMVQHLEETSGTFSDSTLNPNTGTQPGGVTYGATGAIGNATGLDGSSTDYINVGNHFSLSPSPDITVEAWLKYPASDDGEIVSKHNGSFTGYAFRLNSNGTVTWFPGNGFAWNNLISTVNLTPSSWYYVVATNDSSYRKIYINGVESGSGTGVYSLAPSTVSLMIGTHPTSPDLYLYGTVDEVRISGVSRSADWIRASYLSGMGTLITHGESQKFGPVSENRTYAYTGSPKYLGTGWDQEYHGFEEIRETDAAGNYVKHWFYTTGVVNGKGADQLHGKEYKTQWYSANSTLLREKTYDWKLGASGGSWWNAAWSSRQKLTLNTTNISENLTDFPVLVHLTSSNFNFSSANVTGKDIRFIDSNNSTLDYEIETWNATASEAWVWVRVPSLTGNSTSGYMWLYYDNPSAGDSQNATGVWNSNYRMVTHMKDNPSDVTDSTSNNISLTKPLDNPSQVTGKIGDAQNFSGGGSYIHDGTGLDNYTAMTIEAWVYISTVQPAGGTCLVNKAPSSDRAYGITFDTDNLYFYGTNTTDNWDFVRQLSGTTPYNEWVYYAFVFQGSTLFDIYKNGDNASGSLTGAIGPAIRHSGASMDIGKVSQASACYYRGKADEIRFSDKNRSAEWIKASYLSQTDQLISYGSYAIQLVSANETVGSKTAATGYEFDSYGNVTTEYLYGDTANSTDNATIHRLYSVNATANILNKLARERVYPDTVTVDNGGSNLKKETFYYYDNATSYQTAPVKGNLTRLQQSQNATSNISSYFAYDDSYGNMLSSTDPKGNSTNWTYETTYNTYPQTKTVAGLSENYTYDIGTTNLLGVTDINGQTINYYYDAFKRLTKVVRPGDTFSSPSTNVSYPFWGAVGQQHIKTEVKIASGNYSWQKQFFDGLGRVIQVQAVGEPATGSDNHTIISGTTMYGNRGLVDKQYVSQDLLSSNVSGYRAPDASWKYASYQYDGLGRVTTLYNADGTNVTYNYSTAWQTTVINELGNKKDSIFDAFGRLSKVQERTDTHALYATTTYAYDVLGNLKQVTDNATNTTNITYDWLSRKITMQDPDMGAWSYGYDANGNTVNQTDAKGQVITFTYDALNRLSGKTYPAGANMTNVAYAYDNVTDGGPYAKGRRTSMIDGVFVTRYRYDERGRLISENRTLISDSSSYVTKFAYDGADRNTWILYPNGENVTQTYNGRGLPYSLTGSTVGNLVTSTLYNQLGQVTKLTLGNTVNTTYSYWGIDSGPSNGYYGRLYEIKSAKPGLTLQNANHTWDKGGNLSNRINVLSSDNETFGYDFLDRLTSVSGNYTDSWEYYEIGNIKTHGGTSYNYTSSKPHAVTSVGTANYTYDANGNMLTRGADSITWDAENRPVTIKNILSGTISRWKLDEGQGTTANDTVGANSGTISGATWNGNALSFDGTGDYVNVGDDSSIRAGQKFTIEAWIKGSYTKSANIILGRWGSGKYSYLFRVLGANKNLQLKMYSDDVGGNYMEAISTANLTDSSRWYHVAVVVDTVNQTGDNRIKLYIDGQAAPASYGSNNFTGSVSWTAGVNTEMGANTELGADYYYVGQMSDARLYGRALAAGEISSRYSYGRLDTTFVYDGDGNRVKKTANGETILYVNRYYEKNLSSNVTTTSYYLGGRLVAQREGTTLRYLHQDHLTGTSVMSDTNGALVSSISYMPFGSARSGSVPTDKKFIGQRLDGTGLYYYGARYYDPVIGRFISPDSIVQDFNNPQTLNRYSYVLNNPLKYIDPSGQIVDFGYTYEDLWATEEAGMPVSQEAYDLLAAWDAIVELLPELAQALIDAEETITIRYGSADGTITRQILRDGTFINDIAISIGIDNAHKAQDYRYVAGALTHETFHAAVRLEISGANFAANEAFAYNLSYLVTQKLGYETEFMKRVPLASQFQNVTPDAGSLDRSVSAAARVLFDASDRYSRQTLWDSLMGGTSPLGSWPGLFEKDKGRFLDVANQVWIKTR